MNTAWIVLIILAIIYVPIYIYVRKSEKAEKMGLVPYGPMIMIRTKIGLKMMDRLGIHKRVWDIFGIFSMIVSFTLMAMIVGILIIDLMALPSVIGRGGIGIEYALAIPGLNPMMPLVYGIIGLVVAMSVHELAHGIQSRANNITVKSSGLLYGVVPVGAFVEPDDEEVMSAPRKSKTYMYAAGITVNFVVGVVFFILMLAAINTCVVSPYGDNPAVYSVISDSDASESGIPVSSLIIEINGEKVTTVSQFQSMIKNDPNALTKYDLGYRYKDTTETVNITLGVRVSSVTPNSPAASSGMKSGSYLVALGTDSANMTAMNVPTDFTDYMKSTKSGDVLYINYTNPGDETVHSTSVVLTKSSNGYGYLGITTTLSGFQFTSPNLMLEAGTNPFHGDVSFTDYAMSCLTYIGAPFQGMSPIIESTTWWYDCTVMDDNIFWMLIFTLFWIFWLNIVLAISNAIPAYPFDGAFIFAGGVDYLLEKAGVKDKEKREKHVDSITTVSSYLSIFVLILVLVVIVF